MSQTKPVETTEQANTTNHSFFAAMYERMSRSGPEHMFMEPLRKEVIGQAQGVVLEVGAGTGLNFALYDPEQVERVEAVEPDSAMLRLCTRAFEDGTRSYSRSHRRLQKPCLLRMKLSIALWQRLFSVQ